jgi:hypothetical protein
MAEAAQPQDAVNAIGQPTSPKRPTRTPKPSAKVREAMQSLEDASTTRKAATDTTRTAPSRGTRVLGTGNMINGQAETGKSALQRLLDAINDQRDDMREMIVEQRHMICELRDVVSKQNDAIESLQRQLADTKTQLSEELKQARDQIDRLAHKPTCLPSAPTNPRAPYAEVARTPPASQPSGARTLSLTDITRTTPTDTIFCTIDTSRAEEGEKGKVQVSEIRKAIESSIQTNKDKKGWRCAAVVKEARNPDRVKVICRDESEAQMVKEAAQKIPVPGVRVLRDQLYPVRVDNANRTVVLDADGNILPGAVEALGAENGVRIAKIAWLSKKDAGKAYGSMAVYLTKNSEAKRLLDNQYFHLAGESAYTSVFSPREGPTQCYNCQEIGHKAFACKKPQTCGRCATQGHHHKDCQTAVMKCVLCKGPHESFSRNCRVRWIHSDA